MKESVKNGLITATVSGVAVLSIFLTGATAVALTTIGKDLNFKQSELQWPLNVYALAYGCLLLLCGRLADIFGSKRMFLIGSAWFAVMSVGSAFAQNAPMFIIFLGLQGVGSAANTPAGISIISSYFDPGKQRNQAFAVLGAGQPIGYIIGMIMGGVLSESKASWRMIFWLEAALAALLCLIGWFVLPDDESNMRYNQGLDWIGAILSTSGLGLLVYDLSESTNARNAWTSPFIPSVLGTSILLIISFVVWEMRREARNESVLLPMSMWTRPGAKMGPIILIVFFGWWGFNTLSYFAPLFYQQVQLLTPLETSLRIVPMGISGLVTNVVLGWVIALVPSQYLVVIGLSGSMASCIIFSLMSVTAPYWSTAFIVMITLPVIDIAYTVANMQMCSAFPRNSQALAGSIASVATRLGTSIGLAITSSIAGSVSDKYQLQHPELSELDPLVLIAGFRAAGWTCLGTIGLAILVAIVGLNGIGYVGQIRLEESESVLSKKPGDIELGSIAQSIDTSRTFNVDEQSMSNMTVVGEGASRSDDTDSIIKENSS